MPRTMVRIDGRRRITLPREACKALLLEKKRYIVLCPGRKGTICVYLPSAFDELVRGIEQAEKNDNDPGRTRAFFRFIFSAALPRVPDAAGRITLHPSLWGCRRQPRRISLRIVLPKAGASV